MTQSQRYRKCIPALWRWLCGMPLALRLSEGLGLARRKPAQQKPEHSIEATWRKVEEACLQVQRALDQKSGLDRPRMTKQADLTALPQQTVQSSLVVSAAPDEDGQEQELRHAGPSL